MSNLMIATLAWAMVNFFIAPESLLSRAEDVDKILEMETTKEANNFIIDKNRYLLRKSIEDTLALELKRDKGKGCYIPNLDPFDAAIMKFDRNISKIICGGLDWVKCYVSECRVIPKIIENVENVSCEYRYIIYVNDSKNFVSKYTKTLNGDQVFVLEESDYVSVNCCGIFKTKRLEWKGVAAGFRTAVLRHAPPAGRKDTLNVLFFIFDSTSRPGFIRKMPKSYKFLKNELEATFLTSYNVIGDGTTATLYAMLTGKTELDFPDARKAVPGTSLVNHTDFMFHKLGLDGYRTAYLEDTAKYGTYHWRLNGFTGSPADHYTNSFFREIEKDRDLNNAKRNSGLFCIGDTPQYKVMMNITEQFFKLDGKKYCLTFIADITHDDFNEIASADDDFVQFLTKFRDDGHLQDTLVFVMGDHGYRLFDIRFKYQGKLEERLPLMSVVLPTRLVRERPDAAAALTANAQVLTTPHDIYATILDAINLTKYVNLHKIHGSNLYRGLTLFKPIPPERSCSEAGVLPEWCTCYSWKPLLKIDPNFWLAVEFIVDYINALTAPFRDKCAEVNLLSIENVMQGLTNQKVLDFEKSQTIDGYQPIFNAEVRAKTVSTAYYIQMFVSPGNSSYGVTVTYLKNKDQFVINQRDISRINQYNIPTECLNKVPPNLHRFCYCKTNLYFEEFSSVNRTFDPKK